MTIKELTVERVNEVCRKLRAHLKARALRAALDAHDVVGHEPRELRELLLEERHVSASRSTDVDLHDRTAPRAIARGGGGGGGGLR